jgi:hypothetical protein
MKQSKRKSTGGKVLVIQHGKRASQQLEVKQEDVKQENEGLGFSDDENEGLGFSDDYGPPRLTKKPRASELEQLLKSKNKLRFLPGFGSDSIRFRVYN